MDRLNERLCAVVALLSLLLAGVAAAARIDTDLRLFLPVAVLAAESFVIALLVYARENLRRRAQEERQDAELARAERPETALFGAPDAATGDGEPFSISRSHALFERHVVRAAAPLLALALATAAWLLFRYLGRAPANLPRHALGAAALLAAQAFGGLVFSRYLFSLARDADRRRLRGPAAALAVTALAGGLGAVAAVALESGQGWADRAATVFLGAVLALRAAEVLVAFILELYRPRPSSGGAEAAAAYESRFGRLFGDPTGWLHGAARSLDYQFGFKVSETWFYRFAGTALLPLLLFQLLVLYGLSSLVFLGPEEEGVIERLGVPRAECAGGWRLESGAHVKWPWPFETVRRFPVRRVLTTHIGYTNVLAEAPDTVLWTRAHYQEEDQFLTASRETSSTTNTADAAVPVNLLSFNVPVEYRITNLLAHAYGHADPPAALRHAAYRCLTREAAGRDLFAILGEGQHELAQSLRGRIQTEVDRLGLGVEILFVGLQGVHPPVAIADAFESVVGALEEKESGILAAQAYAARRLPAAQADADRIGFEAAAYAVRRRAVSEAEARQFELRRTAHAVAPAVFRSRYYLLSLREALRNTRLYVNATGASAEVFQFNFEEKIPSSLFDWSAESGGKK